MSLMGVVVVFAISLDSVSLLIDWFSGRVSMNTTIHFAMAERDGLDIRIFATIVCLPELWWTIIFKF